MPKHKENTVIEVIKRNINLLGLIVWLIVFTILFVNVKVLFKILNYIPSFSIATLLLIVSGLVVIGFYLTKNISDNAVNNLVEYGNKTNTLLISMQQEISKRMQMEEELRALSYTDELTGIYNRRGFLTMSEYLFKIANRWKQGIFMLYVDLDNLKGINDTLGHKEGDNALINVVNILKQNYRESDIVARVGGDEFVIIPVGTTGDNIEKITARLQEKLDIHNVKSNRSYKLSVSTGIAYYDPENSCSIDELLVQADKLLYEQKMHKQNS